MKLGFDAKRLFLNNSGLGNYSRNLIFNLQQFYPQHEYYLFTPKINPSHQLFLNQPFKTITPNGLINTIFKSHWRSNTITNQISKQGLDVFHGLSNELPFSISSFKGKKIVTIHDLIFLRFPNYYGVFDRNNYRKKVLAACKMADVIIAISNQTKNDLIELLNIDSAKIVVIYQSCQSVFWNYKTEADNSVINLKNLPKNFILYVGTIEPRKNLLKLVESLKNIDTHLVVVGKIKSTYGKQILESIAKNKLEKKITFVNNISNQQLAALYSNAICLVYPSSFEGFGLPILEALACNCPVITGNNSSLTEVGGEAAIYIDSHNIEEYKHAINNLLTSTENRNHLISHALNQAQLFLPKMWVQKTIQLYES